MVSNSVGVEIKEQRPGALMVTIEGRLDGNTVSQCESSIKEKVSSDTKFMTFDLGKLEFISSMGIRLLLIYRRVMESRGGKILMVKLPPPIKKVIDIANVLPSWGIFESIADADAYFEKMQQES